MKIFWQTKTFQQLSTTELYQILNLRSAVFVVEQNCVFQDIDYKDQKALHCLGVVDNQIVAYSRLFNKGDYFQHASIGRVVIDPKYRNQKWGNDLMQYAISEIYKNFNTHKITISAQLYLKHFYQNNGFIQTSDVYLEDDIEHIEMDYLPKMV